MTDVEAKMKEQQAIALERESAALTGWANTFLKRVNLAVAHLSDFADGVLLITLVEVAFGTHADKKWHRQPKRPIQKMENVAIALEFVTEQGGVDFGSIDSHAVVDGAVKSVIQVLWNVLRALLMKGLGTDGGKAKGGVRVKLLEWCAETFPEHKTLSSLTDFWASFVDGTALCTIVDYLAPGNGKIDAAALDPSNAEANLQLAFDVAEETLGIPSLLSAADIVGAKKPDEGSIMNYLSMLLSASKLQERQGEAQEKLKREAEARAAEEQAKFEAERARLQEQADQALKEQQELQVRVEQERKALEDMRAQAEQEKKAREELRVKSEQDKEALIKLLKEEHAAAVSLLKTEHQAALTASESENKQVSNKLAASELRAQLAENEVSNLTQNLATVQAQLQQTKDESYNEVQQLNAEIYSVFREKEEVLARFREMQSESAGDKKGRGGTLLGVQKRSAVARSNARAGMGMADYVKRFKDKKAYLMRRRPNALRHKERYKPLYFVLTASELQYFDKAEDKKPKGAFKLTDYAPTKVFSTEPGNYTFTMLPQKKSDVANLVVELRNLDDDSDDAKIKVWQHECERRIAVQNYLKSVAKGAQAGCPEILDYVTDDTLDQLVVEAREKGVHDALLTLSPALYMRPNLTVLCLSGCGVADGAVDAICTLLIRNLTIRHLQLPHNVLTYVGAAKLAEAVRANSHIQTLDLTNNAVGDKGAKSIASVLPDCKQLESIDFSGNGLTDAGVAALCSGLAASAKKNGKVHNWKGFLLERNQITDDGAVHIARTLRSTPSVTAVNLANNVIADVGAESLAAAIEAGNSAALRSLNLAENQLSSKGATALAKTLPTHPEITIDMSDNMLLGRNGVMAMLQDGVEMDYLLFKVRKKMEAAEVLKRKAELRAKAGDKLGQVRGASGAGAGAGRQSRGRSLVIHSAPIGDAGGGV